MLVADHSRGHFIGEYISRQRIAHPFGQCLNLTHATAQHHDLGIADVDDRCQRARQTIDITIKGCARRQFARLHSTHQFMSILNGSRSAIGAPVIGGKSGSG